jgi:hypothetical protein
MLAVSSAIFLWTIHVQERQGPLDRRCSVIFGCSVCFRTAGFMSALCVSAQCDSRQFCLFQNSVHVCSVCFSTVRFTAVLCVSESVVEVCSVCFSTV